MTRVLVAGGAGFVGTALCARLLSRGCEVVCVDNLVTGSARNLDRLADRRGFTFVEADVSTDVPVGGPLDAVVNLACPASPVDFGRLSLEILAVASQGVTNLAELACRHGARFVQASTSEVYGDPLVHPQRETYRGNVDPVGPRSPYDEGKRFGEALTMAYRRARGLDVAVVRIFNTYGPGMRPDDGRMVSTFVDQALRGVPLTVHGDGTQTRCLCYVEDLVWGLDAVIGSSITGPVNLGGDDERTILEVAELVRDLAGSSSPIAFSARPEDDPARRRPDLFLARQALGWDPPTTLAEGLGRTIEWFRAGGAGEGPWRAGGPDGAPGRASG